MLSTERAVEAIRTHGRGLADTAEGNIVSQVAGSPGWSVSDLVWHVRQVHYFWAAIVAGLVTDPDTVPEIARPESEFQLLADYREGVERLASVLADADRGQSCRVPRTLDAVSLQGCAAACRLAAPARDG